MTVPRVRAPIVLVHGLLGFDRLAVGRLGFDYFRGIRQALLDASNRVPPPPRLSPTRGVRERADELRRYLDREAPDEPVHLIAHSMGGLDARYLISGLGLAPRVLTLTTLGTPHRGTAVADLGVRHNRQVLQLLDRLGLPVNAFDDLTTESCRRLADEAPDAPGVRYFSVAGQYQPGVLTPTPLQVSHTVLEQAEGPNDGLVSVASATYGESCRVWDGDHADLINWPNLVAKALGRWRDRTPDYLALVQDLAGQGF
jgi:triacylglycerol lipase